MSPQITPSPARLANHEKKAAPHGLPPTGFLRQSALIPRFVPIAPATLWRWVKAGQFPAPVKLGGNTTAWKVEDVRQWIDAKGSN